MMGSAGLASLVAHIAFWLLLLWGWLSEELSPRGAAIYALAWLAGLFLLPYVAYGAALFSPAVAVLDIALVFTIFKGDVRLH
jgi:hypothetical protein